MVGIVDVFLCPAPFHLTSFRLLKQYYSRVRYTVFVYFCGLCARYFDNSFHLEGPTLLAGGDDGARASLCTVEAEAYRRVLRSCCDGATLRELRPGGDVGGDGITCTTLRTGCMVSVERRQRRCREGKGCAFFFHGAP